MGLAHRRYAAALNRREGWSGHLWANRFFSTPLDEPHLWAAVRYVERNPVRANIVRRAEDYRWSSARAHARGEPDELLSPGRPFPGPVADWRGWLRAEVTTEELHALRRCTKSGRPCGAAGFVTSLEALLSRMLRPGKAGRKPKSPGVNDLHQAELFE